MNRTDNGTKNRFHYLRRRLDKDYTNTNKQYPGMIEDTESVTSTGGDSADCIEQKIAKLLKILSVESHRKTHPSIKGYVFGPFVPVDKPKMCSRCGLFVPSRQTGDTIVSRSPPMLKSAGFLRPGVFTKSALPYPVHENKVVRGLY